jgi:hypothetical protein
MAVSRSHPAKGPSQAPKDFFELKQSGGAYGSSGGPAGAKPASGPQREKVMGSKSKK